MFNLRKALGFPASTEANGTVNSDKNAPCMSSKPVDVLYKEGMARKMQSFFEELELAHGSSTSIEDAASLGKGKTKAEEEEDTTATISKVLPPIPTESKAQDPFPLEALPSLTNNLEEPSMTKAEPLSVDLKDRSQSEVETREKENKPAEENPAASTSRAALPQDEVEEKNLRRRSRISSNNFLYGLALMTISQDEASSNGSVDSKQNLRPPSLTHLDTTSPPSVSVFNLLSDSSSGRPSSSSTPASSSSTPSMNAAAPSSSSTSTLSPEADDAERRRRRRRPQQNSFAMLQSIVEASDTFTPPPYPPSSPSTTPFSSRPSLSPSSSTFSVDTSVAKKLEDLGKLRRLQSLQDLNHARSSSDWPPTPLSHQSLLPPENFTEPACHLKAQSESNAQHTPPKPKDEAPAPIKEKLRPPQPVRDTDAEVHVGGQDVLQRQVDRAMRDLQISQDANVRLARQHREEKGSLLQQLKKETDANKRLKTENQMYQQNLERVKAELQQLKQHAQENSRLANEGRTHLQNLQKVRAELSETQTRLHTLINEKEGWQRQLDTMHHKMSKAERKVRCLDHLTRSKLEARQEGAFGPTGRGVGSSSSRVQNPRQPSVEVIGAVLKFNEEVLQTASFLSEKLERTGRSSAGSRQRAMSLLGKEMTALLEVQAADNLPRIKWLLMQTVLEVFMVHWCADIIEAFYPNRQSFADVLIELSSHKTVHSGQGSQVICGRQIQVIQSRSASVKFNEWVPDIVQDLARVLSVGRVRMRPQLAHVFSEKILALVKLAYDLRLALAEKDICGGLELCTVPPDTPFQPKFMDDVHAGPVGRKAAAAAAAVATTTKWAEVAYVAGTSGLGLKRAVAGRDSEPEMVLKPKVALVSVLNS